MNVRMTIKAALFAGSACFVTPAMAQVASESPADAATESSDANDDAEIIVTGQTTRNRPLITASADITIATEEDIARKAPKSTAELLELVPGIFVEATAGAISNNYSVRGLQGGGQRFVQLEEDGLPILYSGGGADFFFDQDLTIDRLEAVKGGSSGVLTVNGAGATINFISRKPNFTESEGLARITAYNYGQKRADFYYSQPISDKLAFNIGGYVQSNPGVRENPFDYKGWRLKARWNIVSKMADQSVCRQRAARSKTPIMPLSLIVSTMANPPASRVWVRSSAMWAVMLLRISQCRFQPS